MHCYHQKRPVLIKHLFLGREDLVYLAKLKEEVEAWQEMGEHVNALAKLHVEFTPEERSLFSVAWKNIVGSRRAAHRVVSTVLNKEKSKGFLFSHNRSALSS
jgi:14-3-3 protein epsilon